MRPAARQALGGGDAGRLAEMHLWCVQPHASCADMITFGVLTGGCIMVWGYLLRSCLKCSRTLKQVGPRLCLMPALQKADNPSNLPN